MNKIKLTVVTPQGRTYEQEVLKVTAPTQMGEITIYPHHIQLFSVLKAGALTVYETENDPYYIAVSSGMLVVRPGGLEIQILADTAERAEHIDVARAELAKKRAEELLAQTKHTEDVDFARLQAQIEKELARIRVGNRYKNVRS